MTNKVWQLPYCIVLPLQEMILRKVVAHLWKGSIFETNLKLPVVWDIFEGDVKEKISNLKLPRLIRNQMIALVKPIGADILNWQVFHENTFVNESEVFNIHSLQHLRWTRTGLIDYRRTAEELIRHGIFGVTKCFELACLYCFEDIILLFWMKLSEEAKYNFLRSVSTSSDVVRNYWAYILTGNESFLHRFLRRGPRPFSFNYAAFEYSALKGNKCATEYFCHRLERDIKEFSIFMVFVFTLHERFRTTYRPGLFPAEKVSDVLCFLLSVMTFEHKMIVVRTYHRHFLLCLLHWQFESNFFDIVDLCWTFIREEDYGDSLTNIRNFIIKSGHYIPKMFQLFFLNSPSKFRKHFVERECGICEYRSIFSEFLRAEDTETIKIIFTNIDKTDRERLVSSVPVCKYLSHFILIGKWNFVEVCIRAARLTKEDRKELELEGGLRYLARSRSRRIPIEWSRQKMNGFFDFLHEMDACWTMKRRAIDEDSYKRNCDLERSEFGRKKRKRYEDSIHTK